MSQAVSVRPEPLTGAPFAGATAFVRRTTREGVRVFFVVVGSALVAGGAVLSVLPGHLGVPLFAVGLIVVLRNSYRARRGFIHLQRRHPRMVFPVRRLIRRDPEVWPVLWQQTLRFERLVVPVRWRRAGAWRRKYLRAK
jgi:hypothetical protein